MFSICISSISRKCFKLAPYFERGGERVEEGKKEAYLGWFKDIFQGSSCQNNTFIFSSLPPWVLFCEGVDASLPIGSFRKQPRPILSLWQANLPSRKAEQEKAEKTQCCLTFNLMISLNRSLWIYKRRVNTIKFRGPFTPGVNHDFHIWQERRKIDLPFRGKKKSPLSLWHLQMLGQTSVGFPYVKKIS